MCNISTREVESVLPNRLRRSISRAKHSQFAFVAEVFLFRLLDRSTRDLYQDKKVYKIPLVRGWNLWTDDDYGLVIEEGRRQIENLFLRIHHVIQRASILMPVGIGISIVFLNRLNTTISSVEPDFRHDFWILVAGLVFTIWGTAIMGALVGASNPIEITDTRLLTHQQSSLREFLARDYAKMVEEGENTYTARLRHLQAGLSWIVLGSLTGILALVSSLY